jgi:hypothetical protein
VHSSGKYIVFFIINFYLLISLHAFGNENTPENIIKENSTSNAELNEFILFPHVGVQVDGRVFSDNDTGYKMETHRIIDLDIFRRNNIVLSLFMNEFLIFNNDSGDIHPQSINYEMEYGNLRWENNYGILSLFADHNCTNIINENQTTDRQIRWYGVGIRWESYGMRPGQKNINLHKSGQSEILNNFHYRLSISRSIHTKVLNYNYIFTGNLRYDVLNLYFFTPYIECSITSLIDDRGRFNRYLESGLRMHFEKGDITPFAGFNHKHDTDYLESNAADLYFIGLRMETLLGNEADVKNGRSKDKSLFPDFHFRGSYGKFVNDDNLNYNTDVFIGLDFLSAYKVSPFINNTLVHNSQKAAAGMFPRYISNNIEAGISFRLDFIDALVEPYYCYSRSDEGNFYKGYTERFSTAGLRILSRNMKTGYANSGIDFNDESSFKQINTVDWSASAVRVFNAYYYNYSWIYDIQLRWNIFRYDKSIPYLSAGACCLTDKKSDEVYNVESGVRIQGGLQWIFFYRFEYRTAVDPGNGIYRNFNLFGIRFEI